MRLFRLPIALLVALISGGPAAAQGAPDAANPFAERFDLSPPDGAAPADPPNSEPAAAPATPIAQPKTKVERLDALFADLKRTADSEAAESIAAEIQSEWMTADSATTELLMSWSIDAIAREDKAAAFDLLDQVVTLDPGHAEGWNRRATLHYEMSSYGRSLADIEQTLAREPRHFGAMMGLATMLEMLDRKPEALAVYLRVLEIYPAQEGAQDAVARLAEETSGRAS